MRETVQIDGVTQTREQVTRAMAELDKPEAKPLSPGDVLKTQDGRILRAPETWVQNALRASSVTFKSDVVFLIDTMTCKVHYASTDYWRSVEVPEMWS